MVAVGEVVFLSNNHSPRASVLRRMDEGSHIMNPRARPKRFPCTVEVLRCHLTVQAPRGKPREIR